MIESIDRCDDPKCTNAAAVHIAARVANRMVEDNMPFIAIGARLAVLMRACELDPEWAAAINRAYLASIDFDMDAPARALIAALPIDRPTPIPAVIRAAFGDAS